MGRQGLETCKTAGKQARIAPVQTASKVAGGRTGDESIALMLRAEAELEESILDMMFGPATVGEAPRSCA